MSTLPPLRFQPAAGSAFRRELMLEADAYLKSRGTDRFGDGWLALKAAGLAAALVLAYVLALTAGTRWHFVPAYVAFLFLAMALAMNTLHDAAHGALFRSARLNRWWKRLASIPVGIDAGYWTLRHVHFHHTYANVEGYDLDTEPNPFLRQRRLSRPGRHSTATSTSTGHWSPRCRCPTSAGTRTGPTAWRNQGGRQQRHLGLARMGGVSAVQGCAHHPRGGAARTGLAAGRHRLVNWRAGTCWGRCWRPACWWQ